uniref:U28-Austrotoxin-Ht1j_1 n=1 Tax=Hickmania troglodytes TaxID=489260 RepID=A0A482ZHM0_9ARAC
MQWVAVAFLLVCLTLAVAEENLDMETAPQQREDCKKGEVKWNGHCEVGVDKCCGRCVRCKCRGGKHKLFLQARLYPGEPATLQLQSVINCNEIC